MNTLFHKPFYNPSRQFSVSLNGCIQGIIGMRGRAPLDHLWWHGCLCDEEITFINSQCSAKSMETLGHFPNAQKADLDSQVYYAVGQAENIWVNQILWLSDNLPSWTIFKKLKYNKIQFMKKQSNHDLRVDHSKHLGNVQSIRDIMMNPDYHFTETVQAT